MAPALHHAVARIPLFIRVVSLHIVVIGSWLAIGAFTPTTPSILPAAVHATPVPAVQPIAESIISGQPGSLTLPRIGLTRDIIAGEYDYNAKQWTLTNDKAQYATMTPTPNSETGQTLIYGHNTIAVFEPLKDVQVGDELRITTTSGHTLVYTFTHDRTVEPSDVSVLTETSKEPRVVLMTCEGWLSQTRRLLYFNYKEAL